jgi:hypothetical protein
MSKLKRKIRELVYGSRTYLPKTEQAKKDKVYFDRQKIRLRKKQAEVKALITKSDKAYKKREPLRRKLGVQEFQSVRTKAVKRDLKRAGISSISADRKARERARAASRRNR